MTIFSTGFVAKVVDHLFGVKVMPAHMEALVDLKRIIDRIEYHNPKYQENFQILDDKKRINFGTKTTKQARNTRLSTLEYMGCFTFDGKKVHEWEADLSEYRAVYESGKDRNFVLFELRPAYDLLVNVRNTRFILLLMQYQTTFLNLATSMDEMVAYNRGFITEEMETKLILAMEAFIDSFNEIMQTIMEEEAFFKKNMNKIIHENVDAELQFVYRYQEKKYQINLEKKKEQIN